MIAEKSAISREQQTRKRLVEEQYDHFVNWDHEVIHNALHTVEESRWGH